MISIQREHVAALNSANGNCISSSQETVPREKIFCEHQLIWQGSEHIIDLTVAKYALESHGAELCRSFTAGFLISHSRLWRQQHFGSMARVLLIILHKGRCLHYFHCLLPQRWFELAMLCCWALKKEAVLHNLGLESFRNRAPLFAYWKPQDSFWTGYTEVEHSSFQNSYYPTHSQYFQEPEGANLTRS